MRQGTPVGPDKSSRQMLQEWTRVADLGDEMEKERCGAESGSKLGGLFYVKLLLFFELDKNKNEKNY